VEQLNPYSAPQTATIVQTSGNFELTQEYLLAAKGGKNAYLGISTILLSYFFGILIAVLMRNQTILILAGIGCLIGIVFYLIGLIQLTGMPAETGAKTLFKISCFALISYLLLFLITYLIAINTQNLDQIISMIIGIIAIIQLVSLITHQYTALIAQRKIGHYTQDRKLLANNLTAFVLNTFFLLLVIAIVAISGNTSDQQAVQAFFQSLEKSIGGLGMFVIGIGMFIAMLVAVFSYSNAYKRIYDSAQEQLKRNSAGVAAQSNNLFQNLP
jgi:hypothetical protein